MARKIKMLVGEYKGRWMIEPDDDAAQRYIDDGYAVAEQTYGTKEMRADVPKKKRGRPPKVVEPEAESKTPPEAESETPPDAA